ncbi:tetratricopeptide repeat protein [Pseudomaricurvus sp. HS19]|uniref:tetratricopeptide repeat protein n=1 Tax=Pseudomaricurvus sp. HS19 TaxID=2692626 RepID=UPI00136E5580|nr:tetratricopeptide repeat protein [Pseudomaricurvus sp. HS19]MYM63273.1 hypothetical protein [Pseudomaricurvus sp. HS19]
MKRVVPGLLCASLLLLAGCQSTRPPSPVTAPGEQEGGDYSQEQVPGSPEPVTVPPSPEPGRESGVQPPPQLVLELEQRGDQLARSGEWQQVIEVAEQGLRVDRRFSGFYRLLGEAYAELGNLSQARRFARQATRLCRDDCRREQGLWRQLNP